MKTSPPKSPKLINWPKGKKKKGKKAENSDAYWNKNIDDNCNKLGMVNIQNLIIMFEFWKNDGEITFSKIQPYSTISKRVKKSQRLSKVLGPKLSRKNNAAVLREKMFPNLFWWWGKRKEMYVNKVELGMWAL